MALPPGYAPRVKLGNHSQFLGLELRTFPASRPGSPGHRGTDREGARCGPPRILPFAGQFLSIPLGNRRRQQVRPQMICNARTTKVQHPRQPAFHWVLGCREEICGHAQG
jgi:hypothetical protein